MSKPNLDGMLKQWARATEPAPADLDALRARIVLDLTNHPSRPLDVDCRQPVSSLGWTPWVQAACAMILVGLACRLFATPRPNTSVAEPAAGPHPVVWMADGCAGALVPLPARTLGPVGHQDDAEWRPLRGAIVERGKTTCLRLTQEIQFHLIFQQICQMPGVTGPYRPDSLLLVAIPAGELEWMSMAHVIWRALVQVP